MTEMYINDNFEQMYRCYNPHANMRENLGKSMMTSMKIENQKKKDFKKMISEKIEAKIDKKFKRRRMKQVESIKCIIDRKKAYQQKNATIETDIENGMLYFSENGKSKKKFISDQRELFYQVRKVIKKNEQILSSV